MFRICHAGVMDIYICGGDTAGTSVRGAGAYKPHRLASHPFEECEASRCYMT